MSTKTVATSKEKETSEKLDLYTIHGKLGMLHYEFHKAMSPLRALETLSEISGLLEREDALKLSGAALIALIKTSEDLLALTRQIEEQDMTENRAMPR